MITRILWRLRFARFGRKLVPCSWFSWWRYSAAEYVPGIDHRNAAHACALDLQMPQLEHFEQVSGQYVGMQPAPAVFMIDLERVPTWH